MWCKLLIHSNVVDDDGTLRLFVADNEWMALSV